MINIEATIFLNLFNFLIFAETPFRSMAKALLALLRSWQYSGSQ